MKYFFGVILFLLAIWTIWYGTGGPLREDRKYPYIVPAENGFEYRDKEGNVMPVNQ